MTVGRYKGGDNLGLATRGCGLFFGAAFRVALRSTVLGRKVHPLNVLVDAKPEGGPGHCHSSESFSSVKKKVNKA